MTPNGAASRITEFEVLSKEYSFGKLVAEIDALIAQIDPTIKSSLNWIGLLGYIYLYAYFFCEKETLAAIYEGLEKNVQLFAKKTSGWSGWLLPPPPDVSHTMEEVRRVHGLAAQADPIISYGLSKSHNPKIFRAELITSLKQYDAILFHISKDAAVQPSAFSLIDAICDYT
jgi:hypothetical protein